MSHSPIQLRLRISAGASRTSVRGWHGDALKISVSSAPERGKANATIIKLLAKTLHIPKSSIRIIRGETQPDKVVEIDDIDSATLTDILGSPD